jgi:hypothetical protein
MLVIFRRYSAAIFDKKTWLLVSSQNSVVLAVGCHDVGQFAKQVPQAITLHPENTADSKASTSPWSESKDYGVDGAWRSRR